MEYLLNAEQMKACDQATIKRYGVLSLVLMERAALAVQEELEKGDFDLTKVLIVCGSGNNGGDGFAIARLLHLQKIDTAVLFAGKEESLTEETKIQKKICENYGMNILNISEHSEYTNIEYTCARCTCVVDAMFGVGLSRPISGHYETLIKIINQSSLKVLAVDIPSGVCADTGKVLGCAVKAAVTITFAFKKLGQILYPGAECVGKLIVKDIGITEHSLANIGQLAYSITKDDRTYLPMRKNYSNKGTYGKALLIAGKKDMGGAAVLAGEAAYRCGTGLVSVMTEACNRLVVQTKLPEAVLNTYESREFLAALEGEASRVSAIGMGPGLGTAEEKAKGLQYLLKEIHVPLVLDADALNLLSKNIGMLREHKGTVIVTPHVGEMVRLTGIEKQEITDNIMEICRSFAKEYQVVCVLKDTRTIISDGNEVCINQTGCSGMATGGSGDVLTGLLTGLLAQGMEGFMAAKMAVYLHGKAGEYAGRRLGYRGMLAGDIVSAIPNILGEEHENWE